MIFTYKTKQYLIALASFMIDLMIILFLIITPEFLIHDKCTLIFFSQFFKRLFKLSAVIINFNHFFNAF